MTDYLIIADASRVSPLDFFHRVRGTTPRDRTGEAEYLAAINAHWKTAKAKSDACRRADGESAVDYLKRRLAPLYAHDAYRREQARLWANGTWVAPEQRDLAA